MCLDLREQIARIDRAIAETSKLLAEEHKLRKETLWFPWMQLMTIVVSSAAVGAVVARLL